ncbi:MAG: DUF4962 domain-containing protein, partial [Chloroflexaceae bacterium]|nr:DUF4962 domain-containing protein [Chloroflexaceae bacterium]
AAALSRPRLFVRPADLPRLRAQASTSHQAIWQPIDAFVQGQLTATAPLSAPVEISLEAYRVAGNQLIPYAFVCMVQETPAVCDLARRFLLAYAEWPTWDVDQNRDLGLSHMLLGNALAYDWLHSRLSPAERATVQASLARRAAELYEASTTPRNDAWNNWWTHSYMQNHYMNKHAALGMAGLALLGDVPAAQQWVDHAAARLERLVALLEGIGDGTWHEGISYQQYGLTTLLPFLVNLRDVQGIDLLPTTYLRQYGTWRLYNHLPGTNQYILPTSDFEWGWVGTGLTLNLLRYVAATYQDGTTEWLAQQIEGLGRSANEYQTPWYVFEFFYYDPTIAAAPPDNLPGAAVFPDLAAVIWRTGWGTDDLVFGFKAGVYGGQHAFETFVNNEHPWNLPCDANPCQLNIGHDHLDTNSFYLARGQHWLVPEQVGNGQADTLFHNTLLIDGQGQYRPDPGVFNRDPALFAGSDGRLQTAVSTKGASYLAADATRRYRQFDDLEAVVRHVIFVQPDYFLIVDQLAASKTHEYTWIAHGPGSIVQDGAWLRSEGADDQVLGIVPLAPVTRTVQLETGDLFSVHIRTATPVDDVQLVHLLYPTTAAAWDTRPTVTLLTDDTQGWWYGCSTATGATTTCC